MRDQIIPVAVLFLGSSGESHQGQDQLDGDDFGAKMRNQQSKMNRQPSMLDTNLEEYQYTVNVGEQSIKIKGKNLEMVQVFNRSY